MPKIMEFDEWREANGIPDRDWWMVHEPSVLDFTIRWDQIWACYDRYREEQEMLFSQHAE